MALKQQILKIIQAIDKGLISLKTEKNALSVLIFHKIFQTRAQADSEQTLPTERLTITDFEQILEFFYQKGYQFVSPEQIRNGEVRHIKKSMLLTFDDGYYNNSYIIPIIEKYNAPVIFFIATDYCKENRAYWWDVLHRERSREGKSRTDILLEIERFKAMHRSAIESELEKYWGKEAFRLQDLDRPFTVQELKTIAKHPLVSLGNHTASHYALAHWDEATIREQIATAQQFLETDIGVKTDFFAYPNGSYDERVLQVLSEIASIDFAITIHKNKNYMPLAKNLEIGRFGTGRKTLKETCENIHQTRQDVKPHLERIVRSIFQ